MAKRFAEHNGLNLTKVNEDILEMWREKNDNRDQEGGKLYSGSSIN